MNARKTLLLTLLPLWLFNSSADELNNSAPWYIGLGIGQNTYERTSLNIDQSKNKKQSAWEFNAGYQITPNLGLELGYRELGDNELNYVSGKALSFSLIGSLPIKKDWSVIGEVGAIDQILPNSLPTGKTPFFGLGAKYDYSSQLSFMGIYRRYENLEGQSELLDKIESNYFGLKFIYRLGRSKKQLITTPKLPESVIKETITVTQVKPNLVKIARNTNDLKADIKDNNSVINKLPNVDPDTAINNISKKVKVIKPTVIEEPIASDIAKTPSISVITKSIKAKNSADTSLSNTSNETIIKKTNILQLKNKKITNNINTKETKDLVVYFSSNSHRLDINSKQPQKLKKIADYLKKNNMAIIEIHGHSSLNGNPKYNLELSLKRANHVQNILSKKFGIDPKRMTVAGYGSTKPIINNHSINANKINQRVEINIKTTNSIPLKNHFEKKESANNSRHDLKCYKSVKMDNHKINIIKDRFGTNILFVEGKFNFASEHIDFEFDSYIRIVADFLNIHKEAKVYLNAHSSLVGTNDENFALSIRRGNAVAHRLTELGIDQNRISIKTHGESEPLINDISDYANRVNQRVSLLVVTKNTH